MSHISEPNSRPIDELSNIPVIVEARFNQRVMDLRDILAIQPGAIVELEQIAGETLSVFVGNVPMAQAEVLVVNQRLAIRITEFQRSES